jgi:hypothetical protein
MICGPQFKQSPLELRQPQLAEHRSKKMIAPEDSWPLGIHFLMQEKDVKKRQPIKYENNLEEIDLL